jgi:hypothetical protein
MGVQNIRIIIPWAGVQPFNRNRYNWANVDWMVNAAAARNMGVLAVLNSTPVWATDRYLSGHPEPLLATASMPPGTCSESPRGQTTQRPRSNVSPTTPANSSPPP